MNEHLELLRRSKDGDIQAQHSLYLCYQHLPKKIAKEFVEYYPKLYRYLDDFIGEGQLILWNELLTYNPSRGKMSSHYCARIKYGLLNYQSKSLMDGGIFVPRRAKEIRRNHTAYFFRELSRKSNAIVLREELDREPNNLAIAKKWNEVNQENKVKILGQARKCLSPKQLAIFNHFAGLDTNQKPIEEIAEVLHVKKYYVTYELKKLTEKLKRHFNGR